MLMKVVYILNILIIVININLNAGQSFNFNYSYAKAFSDAVYTSVALITPSAATPEILYADTINNVKIHKENYFNTPGRYSIQITFNSDKHGKDSLNYPFDITGDEIAVEISVCFEYRSKANGIDEYYPADSIPQGYIWVAKHYNPSPSIKISLDESIQSNKYYKGPFFRLENHSNDTIYGMYLPGYFWGVLYHINNSTGLSIMRQGRIDYEFVPLDPLYPGSSATATVGSFGLYEKLPPGQYQYELIYFTQPTSLGTILHKDNPHFRWWTATKGYHTIKYEFGFSVTSMKYEYVF